MQAHCHDRWEILAGGLAHGGASSGNLLELVFSETLVEWHGFGGGVGRNSAGTTRLFVSVGMCAPRKMKQWGGGTCMHGALLYTAHYVWNAGQDSNRGGSCAMGAHDCLHR